MKFVSFPNSGFVSESYRVLMEDRDEYRFDYQTDLLSQEYQEEFWKKERSIQWIHFWGANGYIFVMLLIVLWVNRLLERRLFSGEGMYCGQPGLCRWFASDCCWGENREISLLFKTSVGLVSTGNAIVLLKTWRNTKKFQLDFAIRENTFGLNL